MNFRCKDAKAIMSQVVCPKPRRAGPSNFNSPSMAVPLRFHTRDDAESKPVAELLGAILKEDFQADRCANLSSSPPFFLGSPPCRAPNPLVRDARFGVEKLNFVCVPPSESASPRSAQAKEHFGKKQVAVRVEGFDCSSPRAVAMA
ncbi:hypothetical protein PHJA_001885700 [Phtheirospermum japonicum]|uniref:Uncharacterized protein n=1 Tax=Phtheirospermum japonicum TaxID=374723 RepID=A0A830CDX8_9LAMI|nr:hypothetical protein PHJA_001885700 [Phtheirospermum japonicum]